MIRATRVTLTGITNGFRTPLSQTVQDTLPLPPPTTLIGLLGAAAGISRYEISTLYQKFKVGVIGTHSATYQDLTKIVKYAGEGKIKNPENPSSLLFRENLFNTFFRIWYIPNDDKSQTWVSEAFANPRYALSLGRDDEIVRIDEVTDVELKEEPNPELHDTVVDFPLDPSKDELLEESVKLIPFVTIPLPRAFSIASDFSRTPMDFRRYTFIERYKIRSKNKGAFRDGNECFYAL